MRNTLFDKSLEELWQLFPIYLTEHQSYWTIWFEEEAAFLQTILSQKQISRISHIGSTAIATIWAKPIIDVLLEVPEDYSLHSIKEQLQQHGYLCMSEDSSRISLNKGYTETGFAEKVYHLHLRYVGDNNELYFRDYLIEHPVVAKEYEALKFELWKVFIQDRDGYTNGKTDFIIRYTQWAKEAYGNRYG